MDKIYAQTFGNLETSQWSQRFGASVIVSVPIIVTSKLTGFKIPFFGLISPLKNLEKSLTRPKKLKGETLWDFSTSILSQNCEKKLKGDPLGEKISRKSLAMPKKNWNWGPFGPVRYCTYAGNLFGSVPWAKRVQFGGFLKFCITFGVELFWSLQVYRKIRRERPKSVLYLRVKKRKFLKIGHTIISALIFH